MLALDKMGRCVVIELKRGGTYSPAAMQALDYVSVLRTFTGQDFLNLVSQGNEPLLEAIGSFVPSKELLNQSSRIILMARDYKKSIYCRATNDLVHRRNEMVISW